MKKNYFTFLYLFLIFIFTYCSSEKDSFSEKPPIDNNKSPTEEAFTLFPKDHVPNSDLYGEGEILQNQSDNPKFLLSTRKWQGVPSIGKDKFGNLYVAFLAGSCPGECDLNYLTVSVSRDNGISWSDNKLILSVTPEDSTKMNEANFFNDKFGNLYMYWGKYVKKKGVKEWTISWYSKIDLSDDGTKINYTPPRRIAEGIMLNKLFYSDISDQVIFPIARWYEGDPELHRPFIYKANYGAKSLTNFTKVGAIPVPVSVSGIYEHMIVQLKDNTYLGMIRTKDGIYYSKSSDGNVWEDSKRFTAVGATTYSRFYLGKLNSGRLILIFNNDYLRSKMTVCLSEDDGVTWPYKVVIDNYKVLVNTDTGDYHGVSYPDMIETSPGLLNIVYDRLRAPEGNIIFVKILEDDILKNNTSNIFTTKISTLK
ncbi:BNR repeat protein [Flavobacterium sp. 1]|uniref:sialidase family protein n=1 Tax=Flavobacterium sp. 1 TaxID=2035200 RepID=UPI000C231863|nr:sialidase family protein [Flavobacterium sp. 1]PJJ11106.1 BNR repeat protein [Flavobacterium sp. 1]